MAKYLVTIKQTETYQVEVENTSQMAAYIIAFEKIATAAGRTEYHCDSDADSEIEILDSNG